MSSPFDSVFTSLGLTPDQTSLYTSLLQIGPQTAIQLAKNTPVKRTYVYKLCEQLISQGLIRQEIKGKTSTFIAENPDRLLDIAENQKYQAETAAHSLENILPSLKSQFATTDSRPVVTYFEGPEGIMKANMQMLQEKQTILAYLLVNKDIDSRMDSYWKRYYKIRLAENIHVKAITPDTAEGIEYQRKDKDELRITKLVPNEVFPFTIEKNIAGNKVAFFSVKNQVLIATIIENKEIADTERAAFELAWLQADSYLGKQT